MIPELLKQLTALLAMLRKYSAINVNSKVIKEAAITTGSYYFKASRGDVAKILNDDKKLIELDGDWQHLIRLGHGNNAKASYLALLKKLQREITDLTIAVHASSGVDEKTTPAKISYSEAENILLATLEQIIPTAAASYRQGLTDLASPDQRQSYRGTACEFRESLRETLDLLAPDAEVRKQPWFEQAPDTNRPTMKQKVRYILNSRGKTKVQQAVAEKSVELIEGIYGDIARAVYNSASLSTHVQTTKGEVGQIKRYLDAVLFDVLEIGQDS
jgi:hypothetical protein